ncbi:hypothetical protein T492DRAFT_605018, partial [Pavlovales sp. CCMP2436]
FQRAARQIERDAQHNYALCHLHGDGVDRNEIEAVCWFRLSAEQGHAPAQNSLRLCYLEGTGGLDQDDASALHCFRSAAAQGEAGCASAQLSLGICYSKGTRVAQDEAESARWFRLVADQGLATAQFSIGARYRDGLGLK